MSLINTKGVAAYISKGDATPVALVPTGISSASQAVVTVAATTGIIKGDIVTFETTGFPELDGKNFAVGAVTATTFEVIGGNTTGTTGTLGANPKASVIAAADQVKLCLSQMDIGADSVNQIDVGTFCEPSAQVPGKPTPGTVTLSGYADKGDLGLKEIIKASEDQQERFFEIVLPGTDNGYLVGKIALAGFTMSVPLEGVVGWTVSGSQAAKIRWVY